MSVSRASPEHCAGLGLVELIVAIAILGVTLGAAWRALAVTADHLSAARDRVLGQWVAEDALAGLRAMRAWPEPGQREYEVSQAGRPFRVFEQTSATPNASFRVVRIRVGAVDAPGAPLIELSGFLRFGAD
jgi:general secretion pathway protein I